MKFILTIVVFYMSAFSQYELLSGRHLLGEETPLLSDLPSAMNPTARYEHNFIIFAYFNPAENSDLSIKSMELFYHNFGVEISNLSFDLFSDFEILSWGSISINESWRIASTLSYTSLRIKNYSTQAKVNFSLSGFYKSGNYTAVAKILNIVKTNLHESSYSVSVMKKGKAADMQLSYFQNIFYKKFSVFIKLTFLKSLRPKFSYDFFSTKKSIALEVMNKNWMSEFVFSQISNFGYMYSISIAILF